MTPDKPEAGRLLATARAALKDDILPEVPEEKRLDLLMILNILGVAERALADGADRLPDRQAARLDALDVPAGADETARAADLAAAIRAGEWDDPAAARRLHALLSEDARDRLARANPKYLQAVEAEEAEGGTPG